MLPANFCYLTKVIDSQLFIRTDLSCAVPVSVRACKFVLFIILFFRCLTAFSQEEMPAHSEVNQSELNQSDQGASPMQTPTFGLASRVQYICPMHSHIVKDHPGTCPICNMDLVERQMSPKPENLNNQTVSVSVTGEMQQAMALTTQIAKIDTIRSEINTYGTVLFDETTLTHIHPRAAGWIELLKVNALGQRVKQGDLLYEMYAPDLLVAQEDYLSLLLSEQNTPALLERGKNRLRLLGFNSKLIKQLAESKQVLYRVPYYAEQDSIVSALNVREGMYTEASNRIMTLANLSRVWVVADVFGTDIGDVKLGQPVELDIPSLNLYSVNSRIDFIYPTLDPVTRTLKVRLGLPNRSEQLKPDMLVNLRILSNADSVLVIPEVALIQTQQHNRIFVRTQNDVFELREVEVGRKSRGRVEILNGLESGEEVVTSGQFLLDSEASLKNAMYSLPNTAHTYSQR